MPPTKRAETPTLPRAFDPTCEWVAAALRRERLDHMSVDVRENTTPTPSHARCHCSPARQRTLSPARKPFGLEDAWRSPPRPVAAPFQEPSASVPVITFVSPSPPKSASTRRAAGEATQDKNQPMDPEIFPARVEVKQAVSNRTTRRPLWRAVMEGVEAAVEAENLTKWVRV